MLPTNPKQIEQLQEVRRLAGIITSLRERIFQTVTLNTAQTVVGNKNFVGNLQKDGVNVLTENALENLVLKEEGKGLSENDLTDYLKEAYDLAVTVSHAHTNKEILDTITAAFTTEQETKLAGLQNYDDSVIVDAINQLQTAVNLIAIQTIKVNGNTITPIDGVVDIPLNAHLAPLFKDIELFVPTKTLHFTKHDNSYIDIDLTPILPEAPDLTDYAKELWVTDNYYNRSTVDSKDAETLTAAKVYADTGDTLKVNIADVVNNLLTTDTDKPLSALQGKILKELIEAKEVGRAYTDIQAMVTDLNAVDINEFRVAFNLLIVALDVPDFWVASKSENSIPYTYTTDEALIEAVKLGPVQIGHYFISLSETAKVDLEDYVQKTRTIAGLSLSQDITKLALQSALDFNTKVDKVEGKGLSTNDYTTLEKNKLAGIEAEANKYILPADVVQDANYVHTDNNFTSTEKTKLASLENYGDTAIWDELDSKVDKVVGKGLSEADFTTTEKNKLAGIAEGAQVNEVTSAEFNNVVNNITKIYNSYGGFSGGRYSSSTSLGGAVGAYATSIDGFAGGYNATTTYGGAVGHTARSTYGGAVGHTATTKAGGAVGHNATSIDGFAGGYSATTTYGGAVGHTATTKAGGAVGHNATSIDGFAGGYRATANGIQAVQLGEGTNDTDGTLQFRSYQLLTSLGYIPGDRYHTTSAFSGNGCVSFTSGLKIQWGTIEASSGWTNYSYAYPLLFNTISRVFLTPVRGSENTGMVTLNISTSSISGFRMARTYRGTGGSSAPTYDIGTVQYFAIGY